MPPMQRSSQVHPHTTRRCVVNQRGKDHGRMAGKGRMEAALPGFYASHRKSSAELTLAPNDYAGIDWPLASAPSWRSETDLFLNRCEISLHQRQGAIAASPRQSPIPKRGMDR